jgi:hypothetical protein
VWSSVFVSRCASMACIGQLFLTKSVFFNTRGIELYKVVTNLPSHLVFFLFSFFFFGGRSLSLSLFLSITL